MLFGGFSRPFSMFLVLACLTRLSWGQGSDAALRDRVAQLVERLGSMEAATRQSAEEALIKLGARALPLLPAEAEVTDANRGEGLGRVRAALEESAGANLGASMVTIQGQGLRLTEALRQLQSQSGNPITDLREQFGAEATNPALDLDIKDKPFFEALDILTAKAGVVPNFFTGDGSIGLMAGYLGEDGTETRGEEPYRAYAGPFRIVLRQVFASRDFRTGMGQANAQIEVAWEPRLRPMLLALKAEGLKIVDDRGESVEPTVMQESTDVVLRPENPAAEINLNMEAPDRTAKSLATLGVEGAVTLPAALKTFRFPKLDAKDVEQKQGEVSVRFEGMEIDGPVWKVRASVSYPGGGPAFESYRQGLFNNRLWLERSDGSRFEWNGGYSNMGSDAGRLGFEYLFVDAPGRPADYQFVYETPGKVVTVPLKFEFQDVPLP